MGETMAEDLDDGEFWLPSHFLTDDDIVMDFDFPPLTNPGLGKSQSKSLSGFTSNSDLDFTSGCTETESDEEDISLTGSGRVTLDESTCPVHSKGSVLSSSPQSTLCGCLCNQGSSRDSPSGPVSPPKANEKEDNATLDLLNKAAGEVARLKLKTGDGGNNNNNNSNNNKKISGTGFFDCSQKGVLYPAPLRNPDHFPPVYLRPQFHLFPPMVWTPSVGVHYNQPKQQQPQQQPQPQPQNRATKNSSSSTTNTNNVGNNNNNKSINNNRPLGLPPSAWPPLQAQNMKPAAPAVFPGHKRECAGTGVFLPRRVTTPTDTRKKSEGNTNSTKTKSGKVSQSNNRRKATTTTTTTANANDIQLPQEWTY